MSYSVHIVSHEICLKYKSQDEIGERGTDEDRTA